MGHVCRSHILLHAVNIMKALDELRNGDLKPSGRCYDQELMVTLTRRRRKVDIDLVLAEKITLQRDRTSAQWRSCFIRDNWGMAGF